MKGEVQGRREEGSGPNRQITATLTFLVRLLGNFRRVVVTNVSVECGNEHERGRHIFFNLREVGDDARCTVGVKRLRRRSQQFGGLEDIPDLEEGWCEGWCKGCRGAQRVQRVQKV